MLLHYQCKDRTVDVAEPSRSLLEVSIAARIPHWCECGGNDRCTTCRVKVIAGADNLSPQTPVERRMADLYGWDSDTRLACQTRLLGNATIERMVTSGGAATQLQIESLPNRSDSDPDLAVLICDLRPPAKSSGGQSPAAMVDVMARYVAAVSDPISLNNGVIHRDIGAAITGLFGHAGDTPDSACQLAARAGLGIVDAIARLNTALEDDGAAALEAAIAIHYGPVTVKHVGHPSLQQVSLAGETIDEATRLQAQAPATESGILFSAAVQAILPAGMLAVDDAAAPSLDAGALCAGTLATPDPLLIAQESLAILFAEPEGLARTFYDRLFAAAPQLRALFSSNMESQILAIDHMLQSIVYSLTRPEQLRMGLQELGRRHIGYGVKYEHYAIIRAPLLAAIEDTLGDESTAEKLAAWQGAIDAVLGLMNAEPQS